MAKMNENAGLYKQSLCYNAAIGPYQCVSAHWWICAEKFRIYQPRHQCQLEPLNCGEAVFGRIAADVAAAEKSVDIITWGFDPGMVLVRDGSGLEVGTRYGDLLKRIASDTKGVMVRLLVWHDDLFCHLKMKNNPGYYGSRFPGIGVSGGYLSEEHQRYNEQWFDDVIAGKYPNIALHVREIALKHRDPALAGEIYDINAVGWLGSIYPTHHQKMVLIDYEEPNRAIGYVMGHNSITDFWDTERHDFQDPLRERFYSKDPSEMHSQLDAVVDEANNFFHTSLTPHRSPPPSRKQKAAAEFVKKYSYVAKPYQDVSLRLRGPVLFDLNHNFCQAWTESSRANFLGNSPLWLTASTPLLWPVEAMRRSYNKGMEMALPKERDQDFIARRKLHQAAVFKVPNGQHSAQLMRTQPMHGEKAIKECYANLTRLVHRYIFIQNQYVQYEDWTNHLKDCVQKLRSAGFENPIYVFILTSTPETPGMDRPTYSVVQNLGQSQAMTVEHAEAVEKAKTGQGKWPITPEELAESGINVVMGSLWTCAKHPKSSADYEEIYIHAKVAVVDDAAFTIGSANLNVRSMALDSELNILSEAMDIAFDLRTQLFVQCTTEPGPSQFGDMRQTFISWQELSNKNNANMVSGRPLKGQLLPFHVARQPGSPVL